MAEPGTMLVPECTKIDETKMNNTRMNAPSGISIRHLNGS